MDPAPRVHPRRPPGLPRRLCLSATRRADRAKTQDAEEKERTRYAVSRAAQLAMKRAQEEAAATAARVAAQEKAEADRLGAAQEKAEAKRLRAAAAKDHAIKTAEEEAAERVRWHARHPGTHILPEEPWRTKDGKPTTWKIPYYSAQAMFRFSVADVVKRWVDHHFYEVGEFEYGGALPGEVVNPCCGT